MENKPNKKTGPNQESEKLRAEVQPEIDTKSHKRAGIYEDTEKDLNAKILKVTLTIQEEFPEMSKFIEELPVTIPNEEHPDLELKNLIAYYHTLSSILHKYRLEHPKK